MKANVAVNTANQKPHNNINIIAYIKHSTLLKVGSRDMKGHGSTI